MKVLVIGSGGREHVLVGTLARSSRGAQLYCAPGNAGIAKQAQLVPIAADDVEELCGYARREAIDLTIVGPEAALTMGIVDAFGEAGLCIVGPSRAAAELEGSKIYSKDLMLRCGVPTAAARCCANLQEARDAVQSIKAPLVVKADGLAAGKGVLICRDEGEAREALRLTMEDQQFGAAGDRVVVEEFLEGEEASFMALVDDETILPLTPSQDHKPAFDGDAGPNTGGMGAYAPAPVISREMADRLMREVMEPVVYGMASEGRPFRGVLYAGLMVTADGPRVLEFNVRFGDPEAQVILPLIDGDLLEILTALAHGKLHTQRAPQRDASAVCVVLASGGYPGVYEKNIAMSGLEDAEEVEGVSLYHAGTRYEDGRWRTNGGRVLGVTALAPEFTLARQRAYAAGLILALG